MEKIGRGRGTGKLRAILKPKEQLFGGKYGSGGPVRGMGTEEKSVGAVKDFANKGSHQGITSADHALEGSTTSLQPRSKVSPESRRKRSILNPLRKKQLDHTAAEENEAPRPLRSKYLTQSKELSGARLATSDVSPAGDQGQQPAAFTTPMVHGPMQTLKGGGGKLSPTNSLIRKKLTQKRRKGSLPLTSVPDGSKVDFSSKGKERKTKKLPSECSSLNSSITCTANTVDCVAISGDDARQDDNGSQDDGRDPSLNESRDGQLTPYDEEDEEEAVHRYMESNKASIALEGPATDDVIGTRSDNEPFSHTLCDAEGVSLDRPRTPMRNHSVHGRMQRTLHERIRAFTQQGCDDNHQTSSTTANSAQRNTDGLSDDLCRSLSLYDAFYLDKEKKAWIVDNLVLARCLNYIGLMDYDHPKERMYSHEGYQLSASAWAQLSSPLKGASPPAATAAPNPQSPYRSSISQSTGCSSPPLPLGFSKLLKPPDPAIQSDTAPALYFDLQEAMRWLAGQEYVIGTIIACCTRDPEGAKNGTCRPYLSPAAHPIKQIAAIVRECFPHWGSISRFTETWEKQVVLVLGTAAPSHQSLFPFPEQGVLFSSDMEGGNIARVEAVTDVEQLQPPMPSGGIGFTLWMEPEPGCCQRLWFRFAFAGVKPNTPVTLRIANIQPTTKLYTRNGMRPVWRAGNSSRQWIPVGQCNYRTVNDGNDGELTFVITPRTNDVIHVSFCVPYTYGDLLCHITHWHNLVKNSTCDIWFEERVLCYTQDGRKLHMLIITSSSTKTVHRQRNKRRAGEGGATAVCANSSSAIVSALLNNGSGNSTRKTITGPYSQFEKGKKVVLMSGRVHPGETTGSHGIHGAISFLLSCDPNAAKLRDHFIFYIVPMLNPDGVSRGHTRLDQNGFNLNRCYNRPNPQIQPTVSALRKVFDHLRQVFEDRFFMYLDFHSHVSQSSCFAFGNCLPSTVQHWNMLFPKIISLHAKDLFGYSICRFGRGHMLSKEGSSRVLFGSGLIHSYTIELTYFTNNKMFIDGVVSNDTSNLTDADTWESRYACTQPPPARSAAGHNPTSPAASPRNEAASSATGPTAKFSRRFRNNCSQRLPRRGEMNAQSAEKEYVRSDLLRRIRVPCILSQSAEIGRACMHSLLDYCAVENYVSPQFGAYGGMERMLRDIKRNMGTPSTSKSPAYRLQSTYK